MELNSVRGRYYKGVSKKKVLKKIFFALLLQEKVTMPASSLIKKIFTPLCRGETDNSMYISIWA